MKAVDAKTLVQALAAAWRVNLSEPTAALYIKFMADVSVTVARRAAADLIATHKFFPSIAEVRTACKRRSRDNLPPEPAEAWLEVMEQLEAVGFSKPPQFSHPLVHRAVRAIGWRALGESTRIGVERAHFLQIYGDMLSHDNETAARLPESMPLFLSDGRTQGQW